MSANGKHVYRCPQCTDYKSCSEKRDCVTMKWIDFYTNCFKAAARKSITAAVALALSATAFAEIPVEAEVAVNAMSKKMLYGVAETRRPVYVPEAFVGVAGVFVGTEWCVMHDGQWHEANGIAGYGRTFAPEDLEALPTSIGVRSWYAYERHPHGHEGDTQFVGLALSAPEVVLEPCVSMLWDVARVGGLYARAHVGHTFRLTHRTSLRLELGQGFGSPDRAEETLGVDRCCLMDTSATARLVYSPCEGVSICPYVSVYEFLFDRDARHGARNASADGRNSFHVVAGVCVCAEFE